MSTLIREADSVDCVPGQLEVVDRLGGRFDPEVPQGGDADRPGLITIEQLQYSDKVTTTIALRLGVLDARDCGEQLGRRPRPARVLRG